MSVRKRRVAVDAVLPGTLIRGALAELGKTQGWLATEMGVASGIVSNILNGRRVMSVLFAIRIERVMGIPAELLLDMQTRYDLAVARAEQEQAQPTLVEG